MEFLAKIGLSIALFFTSIFPSTLGFLHLSQPIATSTPQTAQKNSQAIPILTINGIKSLYSKDNTHVYFSGEILLDADPSTFKAYIVVEQGGNSEYGIDKDHVYFFDSIMPEVDPPTFVVFKEFGDCGLQRGCTAQDKNHKYYQDQIVQEDSQTSGGLIPILDKAGNSTQYYRSTQHIYENDPDGTTKKLIVTNADPATFKVLDSVFAIDDNHVFTSCNDALGICKPTFIIPNINPKTLVLHVRIPNAPNKDYARDATHLLNGALVVAPVGGFDLDSLEFYLNNSNYLKDKNAIYAMFHGNFLSKIENVDIASFEAFYPPKSCGADCSYDAQDKNHKYLQGQIVQ